MLLFLEKLVQFTFAYLGRKSKFLRDLPYFFGHFYQKTDDLIDFCLYRVVRKQFRISREKYTQSGSLLLSHPVFESNQVDLHKKKKNRLFFL